MLMKNWLESSAKDLKNQVKIKGGLCWQGMLCNLMFRGYVCPLQKIIKCYADLVNKFQKKEISCRTCRIP